MKKENKRIMDAAILAGAMEGHVASDALKEKLYEFANMSEEEQKADIARLENELGVE